MVMEQVTCTRRVPVGSSPQVLSARACGLSWLMAKSGNPDALKTSVAECIGCQIGEKNAEGLETPEAPAAKRIAAAKAKAKNRTTAGAESAPKKELPMAKTKQQAKAFSWTCPDCGKKFASAAGKSYHLKHCKGQRDAGPNVPRRQRSVNGPSAPDLTWLMTIEINEDATVGELLQACPDLREPIIAALRERM